MQILIRKFCEQDIEKKVEWINNPDNNRYLHYDLPLSIDKTAAWFLKNKDLMRRYDAVIDVDGIAVGLIGLLEIDEKNRKAEFYITLGEKEYRGKGIASKASKILLEYAFNKLELNKVYLYTEKENISAQRMFERIGFQKEGLLQEDLIYNGRKVDRFIYGITSKNFIDRTDNNSENYQ